MSTTIEIKENDKNDYRLSIMTERPDTINGKLFQVKSGIEIPLTRTDLEVLSAEILDIL